MRIKQTSIFIILGVILFFSGAFSLIYQIAWVRFLTLLLGSTTMGITTVVAVFMSGLAIGSWLASKYLISTEKPLKVYAILEAIISITAFLSPLLFSWAFSSLPELLQKFGDVNTSIVILRIIFSSMIMLIPTICMGATLPVLGKYLQQYSSLAERRIAIIYGLNTIGASVGCIASGYFLLREIGLISTIYIIASANVLLPVLILLMPNYTCEKTNNGRSLKKENKQKSAEDYLIPGVVLSQRSKNMILLISAIVGFIGLTSELVWTRMIVLSVGGSIYAYSTILAVYLFFYGVGAALGGYSLKYIAVKYESRSFDVSRSVFFILLLLIPLATTITISIANILPDYYIRNFNVEASSSAYGMFLGQLFPAIMLMSAATMLSGIFFSYGLFLMKQRTDNPASNTSLFYTWNTVGGIIGTITAASLLIPNFGLDPTLRITSTLLILAALIYAFMMKMKKLISIQILGIVCLIIVWLIIPNIDKISLTSGAGVYTTMFYKEADVLKDGVGKILGQEVEQIYYKDGFTATITVAKHKYINEISINTNGKSDGSSYSDMPTQKFLAHFPSLFHPKPENACVIGYGTGTTVGSLALYPDIKVDAIEIEPAVIEGSKYLNNFNNNPLGRENVHLLLTDGRLHLQRKIGKYDLITSEPSNPWIAGVSDLFTTEFYKLAYEALNSEGVFGQWVHIYSLKPDAIRLVFRSFQEVFPEAYVVVLKPGYDLMIIGCKGSYRPKLDDIKRRISQPEIAADIAAPPVDVKSAYELFSRLILGPEQIRSFAGEGPVNTDVLPMLSYMAPLSLFDTHASITNMNNITNHWESNINILGWDNNEEEIKILKKTQEEYLKQNFQIR